jgi:hypothetical protein
MPLQQQHTKVITSAAVEKVSTQQASVAHLILPHATKSLAVQVNLILPASDHLQCAVVPCH